MHLYGESRRGRASRAMWWIYQYIVTTPVVVTSTVLTLLQDDECYTCWPVHDSLYIDYFGRVQSQGMSLHPGKKMSIASKISWTDPKAYDASNLKVIQKLSKKTEIGQNHHENLSIHEYGIISCLLPVCTLAYRPTQSWHTVISFK